MFFMIRLALTCVFLNNLREWRDMEEKDRFAINSQALQAVVYYFEVLKDKIDNEDGGLRDFTQSKKNRNGAHDDSDEVEVIEAKTPDAKKPPVQASTDRNLRSGKKEKQPQPDTATTAATPKPPKRKSPAGGKKDKPAKRVRIKKEEAEPEEVEEEEQTSDVSISSGHKSESDDDDD